MPTIRARLWGRDTFLPLVNVSGPLATLECYADSIVLTAWILLVQKMSIPLKDIDAVELNPLRWPFRALLLGSHSVLIRHHAEASTSPIWFYSWRLGKLVDILEAHGVRVVRPESRGDASRP
jgi:hypothetical protein